MMKRKTLALTVVLAVLGVGIPAQAASMVFEDNFDGESIGLNYTGFSKGWTVSEGTVDLIGAGSSRWDFVPGNGRYVDMDGTTHDAGKLSLDLLLDAGTYALTFDMAGNHKDDTTESMTVSFGGVLLDISLPRNAGFTTYQMDLVVMLDQTVSLMFNHDGGDNMGMLLDNVKVVQTVAGYTAPAPPAAVPTPAAATGGLILLGGMLFRRRRA